MKKQTRLFAYTSALSVVTLLAIMATTNPTDNVKPVALFFVLFFVGVFSILRVLTGYLTSWSSHTANRRILVLTAFLTALLMLRTTGSSSATDVFILGFIVLAWFVYSEYRSKQSS